MIHTHINHPESFTSQRRGKIARLPANIRHQLNLRLHDAHDADQILPWLNNLPEVRQIIEKRFDAIPISPQNLSAWRQGGFQEWLIHRQFFDTACHVSEQLEEFQGIFNCVNDNEVALKLADYMVIQMTIRFTAFLAQWTGGAPDDQTKTMLKLGQFIIKLQQTAYRGQRQAAELPAIRYRVKHEVQTDLRNEIYRDMIHEKAQAIDAAKAKRKKAQKKSPPPPAPATPTLPANAAPAIPKPPAEFQSTPATPKLPPKPGEPSPIKANQASPNTIPSVPSLAFLPPIQSTTASPNPITAPEPTIL